MYQSARAHSLGTWCDPNRPLQNVDLTCMKQRTRFQAMDAHIFQHQSNYLTFFASTSGHPSVTKSEKLPDYNTIDLRIDGLRSDLSIQSRQLFRPVRVERALHLCFGTWILCPLPSHLSCDIPTCHGSQVSQKQDLMSFRKLTSFSGDMAQPGSYVIEPAHHLNPLSSFP